MIVVYRISAASGFPMRRHKEVKIPGGLLYMLNLWTTLSYDNM